MFKNYRDRPIKSHLYFLTLCSIRGVEFLVRDQQQPRRNYGRSRTFLHGESLWTKIRLNNWVASERFDTTNVVGYSRIRVGDFKDTDPQTFFTSRPLLTHHLLKFYG